MSIRSRARAVMVGLALGVGIPAWANAADSLAVDAAWVRPSATIARVAAGFFTVHNPGDGDRLIKVEAPDAGRVEVHTSAFRNGMSRQRVIPGMDIMAHSDTVLEPGGTRLLFIDLKKPLKEGDRFPVTLTFERAGVIPIDMTVQAPGPLGAAAPAAKGE
ncbi:copper chaperone PCu(A)C [Pararhodospirillum oryzae]|uniref:Copper chaperone PCu(A)C n=1 Tax=Pararhodospirillum oryzae TaxID=478448 RepID=A0A512HAQ3_9PROT|nr:copper chaperone PCu(A)C [Pararhodospirillum oryzae]GEO82537.1 hypothetical protein ROR02_26680 [Pararhodospirillum oryzae]